MTQTLSSVSYAHVSELDHQYLLQVYRRFPVLIVRGQGVWLYDEQGNAYLDFLSGIAVCSVGHCHPKFVQRLSEQAGRLIHVSNLLLTEPPAQLAKRLCEVSGMERVFFTNSGAEACEATIKIARKYANHVRKVPDYEILVLEGSFHGRTMGAVSATAQPKYQEPFAPLLPGFRVIPANDIDALQTAFNERTVAIMLEPIQGEGGVRPLSDDYLRRVRELCDEYQALMIVDEVQAGVGRTGKWFSYQHADILPDVVASAKGLGGGFPIGACLMRGVASTVLQPGDHGTTYGGNPLAASAGLAVMEIIEEENLCENAERVGNYLASRLHELQAQGAPITEVRGRGLMLGVQLSLPIARTVVQKALEHRLILNATSDYVLRLVPPLVLTEAEVDIAVDILNQVLQEVQP